MTATVYTPVEGTNCPRADALETGDLLFPRFRPEPDGLFKRFFKSLVPKVSSPSATINWNQTEAQGITVYEVLNTPHNSTAGALGSHIAATPRGGTGSPSIGTKFDYGDFMRTLGPTLESQFGASNGLLAQWLDMTMHDFLKSSFGQFFLTAVSTTETKQNFFIGHVGVVIKEDEKIYVMDCNITDFAHYRTAIHPYICKSESKDAAPIDQFGQGAIGWANFHCAQDGEHGGRHIWQARLRDEYWASLRDNEAAFVRKAKEYLGRPYGFFDNPKFGDDDRMYCAEFVYNLFKESSGLDITLNDCQTWGWMQRYINAYGTKAQQAGINDIVNHGMHPKHQNDPFFLLHPAALWCSEKLTQIYSPDNGEPYAKAS